MLFYGIQNVADCLQMQQVICRSVFDLFLVCSSKSLQTFKALYLHRLKTDSADIKLVCCQSVFAKTDLLQICSDFVWGYFSPGRMIFLIHVEQ